jgi:phosphatidate cytidylyltransferase
MVIIQLIGLKFITLFDAIAIGLIIGIFGQIGDLVESLLKRDVAIKDSSHLIPGHGGVLDRFDSFLFVSPIIYLYLKIFF